MGGKDWQGPKAWFISKKRLINNLNKLEAQIEELTANLSNLELELKRCKEKSDLMDLLGDKEEFEKLSEFGTLDSIYSILSNYEELQDYSKQLEKQIKKLKSKSIE